jgi:aspartyl-tRNA synthetase
MQRRIRLRHEVTYRIREYLTSQGFYEIETPTLIRSTPEGARDFLVPARILRGHFYALPQSPQLYKQILMVSGFDKYFQIARCYRDEDARGDRQPEFTQLDLEMSFVSRDDVFAVIEGTLRHVFREVMKADLPTPFPRLAYEDAMNRYGSDKPDLRYDLELKDLGPLAARSGFDTFKKVMESGGVVRAMAAPGCAQYSRAQISTLEEVAKTYGARGLAWMKVTQTGLDGGVSKFFAPVAAELRATLDANAGDLVLAVAGPWRTACTALGAVRSRLGKDLGLADPKRFHFSWIIDFPLFEWNEEEKKWDPGHHLFTMPQERYLGTMEQDPGAVKGDLYDLVCNGNELASGSIRIHDPELQKRVFRVVGMTDQEVERRFGFLLEVFRYGAPPHGGIAPGIDRLVMILAGESTIREVIAFPKNTQGVSPMDNAPAAVEPRQLEELGLRMLPQEG